MAMTRLSAISRKREPSSPWLSQLAQCQNGRLKHEAPQSLRVY